jgi:hypothetical protein
MEEVSGLTLILLSQALLPRVVTRARHISSLIVRALANRVSTVECREEATQRGHRSRGASSKQSMCRRSKK